MVTGGHFGRVHDQHQRTDRFDLRVLDLEVDRHGLFEIGIRPASRAEAVFPTEHDQAGAHLLCVANEHFDLFISKTGNAGRIVTAAAWHVGQHHAIVALQFGQAREQLIAALQIDLEIHQTQAFHQEVEVAPLVTVLDHQHSAPSPYVGKRRSLVVLCQRIVRGIVGHEHRLIGIHGRFVDRVAKSNHGLARWQLDRFLRDEFLAAAGDACDAQFPTHHRRRIGTIAFDEIGKYRADFERSAAPDIRRQRHLLDRYFGSRREPHWNDINTNATGRQRGSHRIGVPQILVAIGDNHDPLGRVFRERGGRQLQRAFQIGRVPPVERRFERARVGYIIVVGRHFNGRIPSEDYDPRAVVSLAVAMRPGIPHHILLHEIAFRARNALRLVEHIDHGDLFAHPLQLHLRQGGDDQQ